jgi:hypothetical protein
MGRMDDSDTQMCASTKNDRRAMSQTSLEKIAIGLAEELGRTLLPDAKEPEK